VRFVLTLALGFSAACSTMPTPNSQRELALLPLPTPTLFSTPTSASVSLPTVTPMPDLPWLPTPVGDYYAPPFVPACQGIQVLDQQFKLPWDKWDPAKLDRVIKHQLWNNWTYYRCAQPMTAVAAFYRQWMPQPPYNWFEDSFEEHLEGTLGIYNDSKVSAIAGYRWVYLMFIPDSSNAQDSLMAVTWWNAPYTC
jgi:hypothetical protein